jgi:hypothetical protein
MRTAFLLLSATLLFAACRGKESMASRGAKAYDEAVRADSPIGGETHGGHAAPTTPTPTATDHAAMGHAVAAEPAGHAAMGHAAPGQPADHAAMGHAAAGQPAGHAAMGHAAAPPGAATAQPQHAGHTTAQQMPTPQPAPQMDHAAMGHAAAPPPATAGQRAFPIGEAPLRSGEIAQLRPSSTLSSDPQDAPAPSAVSEANKAAAATSGGHAGHGRSGT